MLSSFSAPPSTQRISISRRSTILAPNSVNSAPSALKSTRHRASTNPFATIPFRITSFADPHLITLIESHSCKKQGRGWGIRDFHLTQTLPLFSTPSKHPTHSNAHLPRAGERQLHSFHVLTSHFSGYPGVGCFLALRQTLTTPCSPLWYILAAHHVSTFRLRSWGRIRCN
jgi:hypothetical protein